MNAPASRPTPMTCAAIVMGFFLLAAVPALALVLFGLAVIPQMRHAGRVRRERLRLFEIARTRQQREKVIAVRSLL